MADSVAEQIAALKDEDWAIREEAATALGAFRDPRAVGPLVCLLRDADRAVRQAAIGALAAIGESSVPVLGLCLADPQAGVQEGGVLFVPRPQVGEGVLALSISSAEAMDALCEKGRIEVHEPHRARLQGRELGTTIASNELDVHARDPLEG